MKTGVVSSCLAINVEDANPYWLYEQGIIDYAETAAFVKEPH